MRPRWQQAQAAFARINGVLDIVPDRRVDDPELAAWVEERFAAREAARERRDFAEADRIRGELVERGIAIEDGRRNEVEAKCGSGRRLSEVSAVGELSVTVVARLDTLSGATYPTSLAQNWPSADVAQLAEHLICNQAVASSILAVSSVL